MEEAARDEVAAAAATLELARATFDAAGETLAAAAAVGRLAGVRHLLGDGAAAVRPMLTEALGAIEPLDGAEADRVRGTLEAALAAAHGRALDLPATEHHAARAIELARRSNDLPTELNAIVSLAMTRPFGGQVENAIELANDVIERARELRLEDEAARAYRVVGSTLSEVLELDASERWLRDGIAFSERTELWNHRCYMTAHLGLALWAMGRWDEADAVAEAALREGRGGVTTRVTGLYVRGYVALGRGRHIEAANLLHESLALGEQSGDILRVSLPLWGFAENELMAGHAPEAIVLTERGRTISAEVVDAALCARSS